MLKNSVESVVNELKFLKTLQRGGQFSDFLVHVRYAWHDRMNLYICLDLMKGGDLRFHLIKHKRFEPEATRFFIASIACGIEACHRQNIIHRDLKPENIVFDSKGYCKLTDFGIASYWEKGKDNHNDVSGTPGYMAPEVLLNQNHDLTSDYFALGVIAAECMTGKRPYQEKDKNKLIDAILKK